MNSTGKIIVLAYPDTYVSHSDEWICKFLPLLGLGTREYIKAGHAALVLIENSSGDAKYFDFGRYVTPKGMGRVRGATTDAELYLPIAANIDAQNNLTNRDEFLIWLDAHPLKTHGEGRLLASVCDAIDFAKAKIFINDLQKRGSVSYGAFDKAGSNCSRFVTDTILAATNDQKIIKALNFNKKFTPSTVGNVEKASLENEVFEVLDGTIKSFKGSAFKENIKNYFHKNRSTSNAQKLNKIPKDAQKLTGTGSSAWFQIVHEKLPKDHFRIKRYNDHQELDFDGVYLASEAFDASKDFEFTYDSHCAYCHILQKNKNIKFENVATYDAFNSLKKVHSA